ncbi:C-type lectin lectoxin-Phi1-like [Exaiptasia diaphana]|uniref:C-type lectin domain-containing protein n=1 Tax=Exaiptasia diaphana TaxID=2652724 RepID=A0A913YRJ9_EXADI|nr:C-type lectin lectoxin-Phi1-like [Exaiptasia diaphana]
MNFEFRKKKSLYGYLSRLFVYKRALDINEIKTFATWNEDGPWIGLNDQEDTSKLSWSDGTHVVQPIPFLTDKPEPAISLRKCVLLGKNGKWLDKLCNMKNSFICEKRIT